MCDLVSLWLYNIKSGGKHMTSSQGIFRRLRQIIKMQYVQAILFLLKWITIVDVFVAYS
jgi:hypothetical protein